MKVVPLGEVATIAPRSDRLSGTTEVSFVGMAQLNAQTGQATPLMTKSFEEVSKGYTQFRNGDVLAAKITPCWENGKVGLAHLDQPVGVGSTEFHVIRPTSELHDRYLLHFLRQPRVKGEGELRMTGSGGQRRVPTDFFRDLPIPLPPLPEQRRIAAILDQADSIREKRRQALAHLDSLTQSIFHDMFGAPTEWESRWRMTHIGDLAESVQYGTSSKAGGVGGFSILRMGNITDAGRLDLTDLKYIDLSSNERAQYTVNRGDMLFNRTNSLEKVGKSAIVYMDQTFAFAGYLVRVRFPTLATTEFVAAYLNSTWGRELRRNIAKLAVNQANISAGRMCQIPIAHPHTSILESFSKRLAAVREGHSQLQQGRELDDELFASLQARAFRGEL